jgi:threonine dehydrogenase-like Zn-dependent dehydrogenase
MLPAIVARPGSSLPELIEPPMPPQPGPGEVLCRTLELGVCGTDREILQSLQPALPPDAPYLVLGHECLARVEQVGPDVSEYAPGDLVVPAVRRALGPRRIRVDMLALGEFVERGIFHEHGFSLPLWIDRPEHLFRVASRIADVAVLAEPLAVSEKAINEACTVQRARLAPDVWTDDPPRVLVTGMGPIGFAAVLAARARGWPVTMVGRDTPDTFRARLAARFEVHYLQFPATPDAASADGEFDLVLECTGSDEIMLAAARSLAPRGVMVWLGSTRLPKPKPHNVERMMRDGIIRNHLHLGTVNSAPRDFLDALRHLEYWIDRRPEDLRRIITRRVTPPDSLWDYSHREPQGIKTVIEYAPR